MNGLASLPPLPAYVSLLKVYVTPALKPVKYALVLTSL